MTLIPTRVLLCPLSSPGFAFPLVAIGHALARAGVQATLLAPPWLAALAEATGLPAERLQESAPAFAPEAWYHPRAVADQVACLERIIAVQRPDVLVTSALCLGALAAGARARLPVVVLGLLSSVPPVDPAQRAEVLAAVEACAAPQGLPALNLRGDCYLRRGVPGLVEDENLVGACTWEPPVPAAVVRWLQARRVAGEAVIYAHQARSFGAPGFLPLLAEALPPGYRLASSTSRLDGPAPFWPPGSLVGSVVPHGAVLPHAAAVVCSGTSAVVLAALENAVPLVVLPAGGEQHELADLVVRAGVGIALPAREATRRGLARCLEQAMALDPAPRHALAQRFAAVDGVGQAVAALKQL